jgi:hypothetical protein
MKEIGTGTLDHVEFREGRATVLWCPDGDSPNCYQVAVVPFHGAMEYAARWLGARVRVLEDDTGERSFERLAVDAVEEPPAEIAQLRKDFSHLQKVLFGLRGVENKLREAEMENAALKARLDRIIKAMG